MGFLLGQALRCEELGLGVFINLLREEQVGRLAGLLFCFIMALLQLERQAEVVLVLLST